MADSSKSKSGGCLGRLFVLIILLCFGGFGAAMFFIAQPQDLSDIGGNGPVGKPAPVREFKGVLKNSIDRGYPVTLTEAEINQWLCRTLSTRQDGLLAGKVSLDRVWVRLEDGVAEVIMVRNVLGKPFTVSMFLQIEQLQGANGIDTEVHIHGGPYLESLPRPKRGGRLGKLVVPQGFLVLVLPSYKKLAAVFEDEIHLAFEDMVSMRIEDGRLVLDPRGPSDGMSVLPGTF